MRELKQSICELIIASFKQYISTRFRLFIRTTKPESQAGETISILSRDWRRVVWYGSAVTERESSKEGNKRDDESLWHGY